MTQPLLGQRSRVELIAELYDRHAAGLFAYSHDQLGNADSASDVLVAVLSGVSDAEPPRAALYALARREIFLRDIVYAPPGVGLDPAAALVERVLGDLRTHQREVLYLSGVCEMDASELSWVLDVAVDTADELTVSACRRFAQSLGYALAGARIPEDMTEVFGALAVAPVRDVLNLARWAIPPAGLRAAVLGPQAPPAVPAARRSTSPLLRQLWPTTPAWPLPLAETGLPAGPQAGPPAGASAFPVPGLPDLPDHMADDRFPDPFAPRDPDAVSTHEATTQPMPRLGDSVLTALDTAALRPRRRLQRPRPRRVSSLPAPIPGDVLDDAPGREDLFRPLSPEARAARVYTDRLVAAAPRAETPGSPLPAAETSRTPLAGVPPLTNPENLGDVLDDGLGDVLDDSLRNVPGDNPGDVLDDSVGNVPGNGFGNVPSNGPGDVLDDGPGDAPAAARPLPGWPLQTDQLDALADRERHRPARASSPAPSPAPSPVRGAGRHAASTDNHRPRLTLPVWATRTENPAPSVERAEPPRPAPAPRAADPGRLPDAAPSDARPQGIPTALPTWSPRTDHLRTPAGRAQLRLPRWVMREDAPDDAPRTAPPNHTLTPYDAPRDDADTVPGNGFPAIPPMPPAPEPSGLSGLSGPSGSAAPPALGGTGVVLSPSRRSAAHGRKGDKEDKTPRSHKAIKDATHHDWAWELIGFVIAVAIAMIVFFAVPMMTTP
ncbi:hypothetical protein [Streptosporangium sp. NPDC002721]|uniref:hypothetical protein n=1 Tax=Streptosporangium sp. NPDC002721 TaxID=3366188 RepID=UPI0036B94AC6